MPLTEVSNAVYAYLQPANTGIANYGTLYQALPKVANEQDLFTNTYPGLGFGATIYMFFEKQSERRIAFGGLHDGRKFRIYALSLLVCFKSDATETEDGQVAYNAFIDGLTGFIQADRTAGTATGTGYGGEVFQWGEGNEDGGIDIDIDHFIPRTVDAGVTLWQSVAHISTCEIENT